MSTSLPDKYKEDINERQEKLNNLRNCLDSAAKDTSNYAKWSKILLIFLGALIATRGTADKLFEANSNWVLTAYTVAGLFIAVIRRNRISVQI